MKFRRFSLFAVSAALLISTIACQSAPEGAVDEPSSPPTTEMAMPGEGVTVRSAVSTWIDEQFTAQIVSIGLAELGYKIEDIQQVDYAALNLAIADGDLDYTTAYYEPGHADFFSAAGGDEKMERLGDLRPDGGFSGYLIDLKTAEEYNLTSVEQLQDPDIAALFDSDNDGKADLTGCTAGWICAIRIEHHLDVYDLRETVEHNSGNYSALLADAITRYNAGESILVYGYSPHWLFSTLKLGEDIQWLEVPFTSLPGDSEQYTEADTTFDGLNLGYVPGRLKILANKAFITENPAARRWFENVIIPAADIDAESLRIFNGENSPEDIRRHAEAWVDANRTLFDEWLEDARQAAR